MCYSNIYIKVRARLLPLAAVFLLAGVAACTDDLYDSNSSDDGPLDGMAFSLSVTEQADLDYFNSQTRAATAADGQSAQTASAAPSAPAVHRFDGDNGAGFSLHTLTLPVMGIHPHTAGGTSAGSATRARVEDIVAAGNDPLNFHDSLTIWGYTSGGTALFRQILLKKVRGWRSSVRWPYETGHDYMRFYAISPSLENLELQVKNTSSNPISYDTQPMFFYQVPDDIGAQRDLLYGTSPAIDIQAGPTGEASYPNAETPKERHLGEDDKVVDMTFRHLLTAVRFAQGKMPVGTRVKRIELTNIVSEGTYCPDEADRVVMSGQAVSDADKGWWRLENEKGQPSSTTGRYTLETNWNVTQYRSADYHTAQPADYPEGQNVYIDGGQVMFLMPHFVSADAQLRVTLDVPLDKDNNGASGTARQRTRQDLTLTTSLGGSIWKKGYTVTYYITVGEVAEGYYLIADATAAEREHSTSNTYGEFNIHSYRHYLDFSKGDATGTQRFKFVPWQVKGFYTGSTAPDASTEFTAGRPSWLTGISGWNRTASPEASHAETGGAGTEGKDQTLSYQLSAQSHFYEANHQEILQKNPSTDIFDLSLKIPDGTAAGKVRSPQESANSYIVNASGQYRFPAVYGNAIGSGRSLLSADETNIFRDHLGYPISEPYIEDQQERTLEDYVDVTTEVEGTSKDERTVDEKNEGYTVRRQTTMSYPGQRQKAGGSSESEKLMEAKLLWEDALYDGDLVITNVDYASRYIEDGNISGRYVKFDINSQKIRPCNAVIGLLGRKQVQTKYAIYDAEGHQVRTYDEETVLADKVDTLWTWHIWVTDEVYPNQKETYATPIAPEGHEKFWVDSVYTSTLDGGTKIPTLDANGTKTSVLPVNLGWVPDDMTFGIYRPREVWVEVKQTEGDAAPVRLRIYQHAVQDLVTGTSTIYQWGRPIALPSLLHIDKKTQRTMYNENKTDISEFFVVDELTKDRTTNTVAATYRAALQNPRTQLRYKLDNSDGGMSWFEVNNTKSDGVVYDYPGYMKDGHDFWGGSVKTLYDPCPPGFQVPDVSVFKSFSKTGATADSCKYFNSPPFGGRLNRGRYFYTQANESRRYAPTVYIPATGEWQGDKSEVLPSQLMDNTDGKYINTNATRYWLRGGGTEEEKAHSLWIYPRDQETENSEGAGGKKLKNAIELPRTEKFSTAMPVRPVAVQ